MDPSIPATERPKKRRILVVDDDPSSTRLVRLFLEGTHNYVVREEIDSSVALSTALEFRPDLILLDIMMPAMDGGKLAACFRASPFLTAVPIVFLTATVRKGEAGTRGLRAGCSGFLAKPMILTDVLACIKKTLGN